MKVSTKVAAGASLLVALLLVALVREIALVRKQGAIHRMLSEERFTAVTSTLELLGHLEFTGERLRKLFVTRDAAYARSLDTAATNVTAQLERLKALPLPVSERAAVEQVAKSWKAYQAAFESRRPTLIDPDDPVPEAVRTDLTGRVESVRDGAISLLTLLRAGIERDVGGAQQEAEGVEKVSWGLAALALLSGVFFVGLIMWTVNRPLKRLITATRSVATGRYAPLNARGSDELAELARALDAMVTRLDEVDRTKREFLSHVSHELKTPLAAMQETNQLLVEELAGPLTDRQRRLIQLNIDAARRLSAMLSRLLDSSRLEAGAVAYDVRPVELRGVVSIAFEEFEARMREKQVTGQLKLPDAPILVSGDRDWLVQVFENLLENAVKFSPPNTAIEVGTVAVEPGEMPANAPAAAHALAARHRCALITVADEGPGIPEEALERVFDRFFQVKAQARAGAGVGLGLAICRDIVAAHGGSLWSRNRPERGSVFSVLLPLLTSEGDRAMSGGDEFVGVVGEGAVRAGAGHRVHRLDERV